MIMMTAKISQTLLVGLLFIIGVVSQNYQDCPSRDGCWQPTRSAAPSTPCDRGMQDASSYCCGSLVSVDGIDLSTLLTPLGISTTDLTDDIGFNCELVSKSPAGPPSCNPRENPVCCTGQQYLNGKLVLECVDYTDDSSIIEKS